MLFVNYIIHSCKKFRAIYLSFLQPKLFIERIWKRSLEEDTPTMAADFAKVLLTDTHREPEESSPAYDVHLRDFTGRLKGCSVGKFTQRIDGNSILQLLDPARNTISYLFVLVAHQQSAGQVSDDELLIATAGFLTSFDPVQARYAGSQWRACIEWTAALIQRTNNVSIYSI